MQQNSFLCSSCGLEHTDLPLSFAADYPDPYANLDREARELRAIAGSDQCIIDQEEFYIRGCLDRQKQRKLYNRANFMPKTKEFDEYYRCFGDEGLLKLRAEGGITAEAEHALRRELTRHNLTGEGAKRHFAPGWLEKADFGSVGIFVLEDGDRVTAEVIELNEEGDRLSVRVISPDSPFPNRCRNHRTIPLHRIVSSEPQPDLMAQGPFSDPCRDVSLSNPRFIVLTTIFLCLIVGSLPLFLLLLSRPLEQANEPTPHLRKRATTNLRLGQWYALQECEPDEHFFSVMNLRHRIDAEDFCPLLAHE